MRSLRTKLALQYALIMFATMVAFAVALYVVRSSAAVREAVERAEVRADLALRVLRRAASSSDPLVITEDASGYALNLQTRTQLDALPGYLLVLDDVNRVVYQSNDVRTMPPADTAQLWRGIRQLDEPSHSTTAIVASQRVAIAERYESDRSFRPLRVVAGVPISFSVMELVGTTIVVLPLLLLVSIGGAYVISGRALEPLETITEEVTAITDGRSLHRRLNPEVGSEEFARLTAQLNAMIGRLETSFGALRRFTADASHELKTPLAVLRADVERAMHVPPGSGEYLVALEEALQETARMANLVESLLTLARADEGRFDLHRERIDLELLVRDVFETAVILGEEAGINVTMPVSQPCTVEGDAPRLRQLFLNLITNAIKYTPRGGDVEMSLIRSDHEATVSVRDTGIGIAAADLPYIFERFYRADRARSRMDERGGFGLGLSISQWIAQAHGGSLTAQSRLHRGSTFTVTLPLAPDVPVADDSHASPSVPLKAASPAPPMAGGVDTAAAASR